MKKALIVEDEPAIRMFLVEHLSESGWDCQEAGDGLAAIEILRDNPFDLILSDMRMPRCDGLGLLKHVRAHESRETIFLICSGFAEVPLWELYARGADGCLAKPFPFDEMDEMLERLGRPLAFRWHAPELDSPDLPCFRAEGARADLLGWGGVFVPASAIEPKRGELIRVHLQLEEGAIHGVGRVNWRRCLEEDTLERGMGIEWVHIDAACRSTYADILSEHPSLSTIPVGQLERSSAGVREVSHIPSLFSWMA